MKIGVAHIGRQKAPDKAGFFLCKKSCVHIHKKMGKTFFPLP